MSIRRIAVIGGGCSGTLVAAHLHDVSGGAVEVVVIERTGDLGPGLAYATTDEAHLLNVPAGRLSVDPAQPEDFARWASARSGSDDVEAFLPRAWYGDYLRSQYEQRPRIVRRGGEVVSIVPGDAGGERITFADGAILDVDGAVLALGNLDAPLPVSLPAHPAVFRSPWTAGALEPSSGGTTVLVGTGLTAVDAALSICDRDPDASVLAVSRGGRLPFAHLARPVQPAPADVIDPPSTEPVVLDAVLSWFESAVADRERAGGDWREVVDGLRPHVTRLWRGLSLDDQRRFLLEHARAWEIRRHRMAPHVADSLQRLRAAGRLEVRAGGIDSVEVEGELLRVRFAGGDDASVLVPRVVACTGPADDVTAVADRLVRQLLAEGRAVPDAHALGFRATDDGRLLTDTGESSETLFVLGPLRRGELWETTAVAEIRAQAKRLASMLGAAA